MRKNLYFWIGQFKPLHGPSFDRLKVRHCKDTTALPFSYVSCESPIYPSDDDIDFHSALVVLHRHELKQSGGSYETYSIEAPLRSILALQVLTRMFGDMAGGMKFSEDEALQVPSFEIYTLYLGICLHIKVGEKSNEVGHADGLRKMLTYLRIVKRKWRVAGK
jgi:hypothetical protein